MSFRLDTLYTQLGSLLESAQGLLAESQLNHPNRHATVGQRPAIYSWVHFQAEVRTLEYWRSIIAECVATFFYTVIVLSVSTSGSAEHTVQTNSALAAGLAMAILTTCFAPVSGCHTNPAISVAMMLTKQISPYRALLYVCAQCGGGIAGAALVYGVYGRIVDVALNVHKAAFGMEFVLTFLLTYAFCASRSLPWASPATASTSSYHYYQSTQHRYTTTPSGMQQHTQHRTAASKGNPFVVGVAYAGCLVAWKGSLNPARALGSAFVGKEAGRFAKHWVFWAAPMLGAVTGAFAYEFVFNPRRRNLNLLRKGNPEENMSMVEDLDMLDDLERAKQYKANILQDFGDTSYGTRTQYGGLNKRTTPAVGTNMAGMTTGQTQYTTGSESVYGGTKSMYNQPVTTYDSSNKSVYGDTRSAYNGYDGRQMDTRGGGGNANLRRSHSISTKMPPRRNPYDYLPDEPAYDSRKPDIMQSVAPAGKGMSSSSPTAAGQTRTAYSPKYDHMQDSYVGDKLVDSVDPTYRSKGLVEDPMVVDPTYDYDRSKFPGRNDFPRRSRGVLRNAGGQNDYFASPQYNASYSHHNGCSITPNSVANSYHPNNY